MKIYDNDKFVEQYIDMNKDYNNKELIKEVLNVIPLNSTLLELGMGEGKDLLALSHYYKVIGSDNSKLFLKLFNKKYKIETFNIDARNIKINKKFDCIYSNKVLHHLSIDDFILSLHSQYEHLNDCGFIFMTLWYGEFKKEYMEDFDMLFMYYDVNNIKNIIPNDKFLVYKIKIYTEIEPDDSMIVVLKKRKINE